MRLDRLLSIVMLLVNRKRIQARELARTFDVSVRTIYRDIEAINLAGIPVITYQGANGGLGIAENYKVDRNVLTQDDIVSMLTALNGLKTTLDDHRLSSAIEKVKGLIPDYKSSEYSEKSSQIIIDMTPWGGNEAQKQKINVLKKAIEKCSLVFFEYTCSEGKYTKREVEPMCLVLKMQTWYLYGFCRERGDYRLFRLSRIKGLELLNVTFVKRNKDLKELPWESDWFSNSQVIEAVLRFDGRIKALVEERFEPESIACGNDGAVLVKMHCSEDDWLYGMILSYADAVEVLEPEHLREAIKEKLRLTQKIYQSN